MPLVDPLDPNTDPETWELAAFFNETLGFCPNSVLTMQRRPAISKAFIELNKAVMANEGRVSSALKRMIAWVSSNATGCRYCQAHAIRAAERYGAEQEQLDNIWDYRTHPAFSEAERAALDFSLFRQHLCEIKTCLSCRYNRADVFVNLNRIFKALFRLYKVGGCLRHKQ